MNLDRFGFFKVAPNGTIFSYDRQKVVIDSRQLSGDDFKAMTGCDMVTPGMPPSAELETEKCLWGYITPGSDLSVKRCLRGRRMEFVELDAGKLGNAPPIVVGSVWCGLYLATAVSGGSAKTGG